MTINPFVYCCVVRGTLLPWHVKAAENGSPTTRISSVHTSHQRHWLFPTLLKHPQRLKHHILRRSWIQHRGGWGLSAVSCAFLWLCSMKLRNLVASRLVSPRVPESNSRGSESRCAIQVLRPKKSLSCNDPRSVFLSLQAEFALPSPASGAFCYEASSMDWMSPGHHRQLKAP